MYSLLKTDIRIIFSNLEDKCDKMCSSLKDLSYCVCQDSRAERYIQSAETGRTLPRELQQRHFGSGRV